MGGETMSKLQKFNQILFTLLALMVMSILIPELYRMITRSFQTTQQQVPLSNQEVKEFATENIITQTISHTEGDWAWTEVIHHEDGTKETITSPYYVIPISQITLQDDLIISPAGDGGEILGAIDLSVEVASLADYYGSYHNNYNNILIYESTTGDIRKIFDQRIQIISLEQHQFHNDHFMILGTLSLSKTRRVDKNPETDFFIYKYDDQSLTKLNMPRVKNTSFITDKNLPFILIRGRVDFDDNGKFDEYDPYRLFKWDFETHVITPLLDDKMTEELQKTLDGRNLAK